MNQFNRLYPRIASGATPSLETASKWLEPASLAELGSLMALANRLREDNLGDKVEFCAIVNAKSGRCSENCSFCAQSAHHGTDCETYPLLEAEEIVARGRAAAAHGALRFGIVTSGKGCPEGQALDEICRAAETLRRENIILPCASLGLLKPKEARRLADAGFARYHHNLEAGPSHFPRICTTHSFEDRVATVRCAQEAGLEVCVGGIVGLGESTQERAELAKAVAELEPESVPLNFLNPIPGTPLGHLERLTPQQALAAVAVFRIYNPKSHIRTCGGRHQVMGRLAPMMYLAGASSTMIGDYLTTTGGEPSEDLAAARELGLSPVPPCKEKTSHVA